MAKTDLKFQPNDPLARARAAQIMTASYRGLLRVVEDEQSHVLTKGELWLVLSKSNDNGWLDNSVKDAPPEIVAMVLAYAAGLQSA